MRKIFISDNTLKQAAKSADGMFSFRGKIEVASLLDKLDLPVIEIPAICDSKADVILTKSIVASVASSIIAIPVFPLTTDGVKETWNTVCGASSPRLQVVLPTSAVQMEYLSHKKPPVMLELLATLVSECKKYCNDVEFIAEDSTRSEKKFLYSMIKTAIDNGANIVTLCDTAGVMLPDEFGAFVSEARENVVELQKVALGVLCSDAMALAMANSVAALRNGASEVKVSAFKGEIPTLESFAHIIRMRGDAIGVQSDIKMTAIKHTTEKIKWITESKKNISFTSSDDKNKSDQAKTLLDNTTSAAELAKIVKGLGYDLSLEDNAKVYEAFKLIADKKKTVGEKELDVIIASTAMQVPPTYRLESFIINSGNVIPSMAHIVLNKSDVQLNGISVGDGPIDAAFMAIEQIIGHHYELDDFQIQSVTEGREAMGSALVKLRSNGVLYSGQGISTDIIGASIRAYLNAINKIVCEDN